MPKQQLLKDRQRSVSYSLTAQILSCLLSHAAAPPQFHMHLTPVAWVVHVTRVPEYQ